MLNVYAESSALLARFLGDEAGHRLVEVLRRAVLVAVPILPSSSVIAY